jgi:hypothetical protein
MVFVETGWTLKTCDKLVGCAANSRSFLNSHLFLEDFREVVEDKVVTFLEVVAQQDLCLFEIFLVHGRGRRVWKEDPVVNGGEGAAHDAKDYSVPFSIDHACGVGPPQACCHVAEVVVVLYVVVVSNWKLFSRSLTASMD